VQHVELDAKWIVNGQLVDRASDLCPFHGDPKSENELANRASYSSNQK
jgi:hypothetical protein